MAHNAVSMHEVKKELENRCCLGVLKPYNRAHAF